MSSVSRVDKLDIWTEKVDENGNITSGLSPHDTTRKVIDILEGFSDVWSQYRFAYGVQVFRNRLKTELIKLQWATPRLDRLGYNPSVQELFQHLQLEQEQRYCFVMSKLEVGLRDIGIRDDHDNAFNFRYCLNRYWPLYVWPRAPVPPDAASEDGAPAKRPATAPAGGGAGGSRFRRATQYLAALRDLQFDIVTG